MKNLWEMVVEGAMFTTLLAICAMGIGLGKKLRNKYSKYGNSKKSNQKTGNKKAA